MALTDVKKVLFIMGPPAGDARVPSPLQSNHTAEQGPVRPPPKFNLQSLRLGQEPPQFCTHHISGTSASLRRKAVC